MGELLTTLLKVGSVFAILAVFAWWARRHGNKSGRRGAIEVISRAQVSGRSSVAVVKVGDRSYLLGVTENQVNLLADIAPDQLPADDTVGGSFAAQLAAAGSGAPSQPNTVGEAVVVTVRRLREARQRRTATAAAEPAGAATAPTGATPTVAVQTKPKTTPKATTKPARKSGTKRAPGKSYTAKGARR